MEAPERVRWREGSPQACRVAHEAPETLSVAVADRAGDVAECFREGPADRSAPKAAWISRACQHRGTLPGAGVAAARLGEPVPTAPVGTPVTVAVSPRDAPTVANDARKRQPRRRARPAPRTVPAASVPLWGPARPGQRLPALAVNAVWVREVDAPAGDEPSAWLLLSSLLIATVAAVQPVIASYCVCGQVASYVRVLKSGGKVAESPLAAAARLRPYLALGRIVAWRVLDLRMRGRECPEWPCAVALEEDEWPAVDAVVKQAAAAAPPLGALGKLIGARGGYLGRKCAGDPGPKALWIGRQRMSDRARAWRAFPQYGPPKTLKRSVER